MAPDKGPSGGVTRLKFFSVFASLMQKRKNISSKFFSRRKLDDAHTSRLSYFNRKSAVVYKIYYGFTVLPYLNL
jgi:hypothetical protein